jgi:hypothetical protein
MWRQSRHPEHGFDDLGILSECFLDFAFEIGAQLPPRAQQVLKERSSSRKPAAGG